MAIVINAYPHNWAYQPSMLDVSRWKDIRVCKAANLAIDRDGMKRLLYGLMLPPKGHVPSGASWLGHPSFDVKYDPEGAKKLLAKAGYREDKPVKAVLAISPSGSGQMQPLLVNEFVQENLKEVGIDIDFEIIEWNALPAIARLTADNPEMRARGHRDQCQPRYRRPVQRLCPRDGQRLSAAARRQLGQARRPGARQDV